MSGLRLARRDMIGLGAATAATLILTGERLAAAPMRFAISHSSSDWKRLLGAQRYHILREAGTEPAFTSPLLKEHRKGIFTCAGCGEALFLSSTKFESGTGWPSFWKVLPGATFTQADRSLGIERNEVLCARCGGHLGHVFDDGPKPTGLRYCMNGLALMFRPS